MFRTLATGLALAALMGSAALAETHEVQMLNKGENGRMVFEPAFVAAAPGDTIKFYVNCDGPALAALAA